MPKQGWTTVDLPAMSGRTVVVTGASSGLGFVTARELAAAGAQVILAVRDEAKGHGAAAAMPGTTEVQPLDLSSLASVRAFAAAWTGPLDILINNAGIMQVPQGRTTDGFEVQIGTNHLGPFALTNLLMPHISDRVVTVSSEMHKRGHIDLEDLNGERRPYDSFQAYCDTKLANLLFTFELQRRLTRARSGVRSMACRSRNQQDEPGQPRHRPQRPGPEDPRLLRPGRRPRRTAHALRGNRRIARRKLRGARRTRRTPRLPYPRPGQRDRAGQRTRATVVGRVVPAYWHRSEPASRLLTQDHGVMANYCVEETRTHGSPASARV